LKKIDGIEIKSKLKKNMKYNTIIWDWNGTLINDRWLAVEVMNKMLTSRKMEPLTHEKYMEVFDFPVKDYYQKVGFDFEKESFEIVGTEFIVNYNRRVLECEMQPYALDALKSFKNSSLNQFVLSARGHKELQKEFKFYKIEQFFESFSGLSDHYANGKTQLGHKLIENQNIDKRKAILIGDTVHDYEVAESLGIDCILVEGGHHSKERLLECGTQVISNLSELKNSLF
jgi:phosphoglycolate phosphatase